MARVSGRPCPAVPAVVCEDDFCNRTGLCRMEGELQKQEQVRPWLLPPPPKGCICPPTSEQTCLRKDCGRR